MQVEVKLVNQILNDYFTGKLKRISSFKNPKEDCYDETIEIYQTSIEDLFLKIIESEDSYGGSERFESLQFVQPTVKTVTSYETI